MRSRILRGALTALLLGLPAPVMAATAAPPSPFKGVPELVAAETDQQPGVVRARFVGLTTLLLDDGETQLLVDGYFTRPKGVEALFWTIRPDVDRIDKMRGKLGADRVAAVLAAHAHFDHAMDSAVVAEKTGAVLVGSPSVANLGRGHGLPEAQIWTLNAGDIFTCGQFKVTVFTGPHARGNAFPRTIEAPLRPPAAAVEYRDDGGYSYLVENRGRGILIQPSANLVPGQFDAVNAKVVFLSVGMLGWRSEKFIEKYWRQLAKDRGANMVVLFHWDHPADPLRGGLRVSPPPVDWVRRSVRLLAARAERDGIALRTMPLLAPLDLPLGEGNRAWEPAARRVTPPCLRAR